jgi:hypothetical protein
VSGGKKIFHVSGDHMGPVQEELHEKIAKKKSKKKNLKRSVRNTIPASILRFNPNPAPKNSLSLLFPLPLFKFLAPLFGYPNRTNPNRPDYPYRKTCSAESELLRRRLTVWNVFLHQRFSKTTLSLSTVILFFSIP